MLLTMAVILALTAMVFYPCLNNGFVNWDDPDYVIDNQLITDLANWREIITTPVSGNFHPLTMLSLAVNHAISGKSPFGYHLTNYLFHLLNTGLLFLFIWKLTANKLVPAAVVAVLFGIHPMHVESVAWVSERKDVLYTCFYLLALCAYLNYQDHGQRRWWLATLGWFVLSLLSKPAAVVLPVILLLLDYYRGRGWDKKVLLEKIPLFLLSIVVGVITLKIQSEKGAVGDVDLFSPARKALFGCYGIMAYIGKMLVPVNLVPFYPFPTLNEPLPRIYWLGPAVVLALVCVTWYSLRFTRVVIFGMLFYLINIALVLQFLTVGSAVIADRYTYVSYIGLFFIIGQGVVHIQDNRIKPRYGSAWNAIIVIAIVYGMWLGFLTYRQCHYWKSGEILWTYTINTQPSWRAYGNRGILYRQQNRYDQALSDYSIALKTHTRDATTWLNRGNIYFDLEQDDKAIHDYNQALAIEPDNFTALTNRGAILARRGEYEAAFRDFARAEKSNPKHHQIYLNRGLAYDKSENYSKAIENYTTYLKFRPADAKVYNARSKCWRRIKNFDQALADMERAIDLSPTQGSYYFNRSFCHGMMGNFDAARIDAHKALELGAKLPPNYLEGIDHFQARQQSGNKQGFDKETPEADEVKPE